MSNNPKGDKDNRYWRRKSSYLPNNLMDFNEIFRKNVSYGKIKSKKKQGFNLSLENKVFKKPQGELNLPPSFLG